MRFVIYGAGAVGATIGGLLFGAGAEVLLIARGDHARALQTDGLRLLTPGADLRLRVPVADHPSRAGLRPDDVVILAMKSQDTAAALDDLAAAGFTGPVVCAQNGVDNERQALRRFDRVHGLCVQLPGTFLSPGEVACHGSPLPGCLDLGRYPSGTDEVSEALAAALTAAGFLSRADPDIMAAKHAKLLGNLGNALDAAVGRDAMHSELAKRARREGRDCFTAAGIRCTPQAEYATRVADVGIVALPGVTQRGSSSWQSLLKGSGSIEADYLNGEIVLLGRLHGVATPVNTVLQRVANDLARTRRPPHSVRLEDLEAQVAEETARQGGPD